MRTSSRDGSPTASDATRSRIASHTSLKRASGTSTRRIAVHFWPVFCVMSRTMSARNSRPASLPRSTSGPRIAALSESASMLRRTPCSTIFACERSMRAVGAAAGERDDVARAEVIEQRAGRADQRLQHAFGQQRLEQLCEAVCDKRGRRRRLGDHRHAGEQRARELLAQAPCREVERVDVHRDAAPARPHVLAAHARGTADLDRLAVGEQRCRSRACAPSSA